MATPFAPLPALRRGDTVAVIAPAGPVPPDRLAPGLALLSARYRVLTSPGLLSRTGYLAGDDGRRRCELTWALHDPAVRAVFCARGGYGLTRILPTLLAAEPGPPRLIVGFSDITALLALQALRGVPSVHGPVLTQLGALPPDDQDALFALVEGAPPPPLANLVTLAPGRAAGRLLGGNLEVLSRLAGTPLGAALTPGEPVVLLLEEIGERPYRIDRALTQLAAAGLLAQVAGVVVGDLIRCEEPAGPAPTPSALDVITERFAPRNIPVVCGAPIGHGARNRAVPLGARVTLLAPPSTPSATTATLTFDL